MEKIKDFLSRNKVDSDAIEKYYSALNSQDRELFKEAIESLRKEDKDSDIWNYWHFKLKVNKPEGQVLETNVTESFSIKPRNFNISNLLFAFALSFFGGSIFFAIIRNIDDFNAIVAINLVSLNFIVCVVTYLLYTYRSINGAIKSIPAFGFLFLYYLFGALRGTENSPLSDAYTFSIVPVTFIFLGFIITQIFNTSIKTIQNNYHSYIQRFVDVSFYSIILSIPIFTVIGICIALIQLTGVEMSGDFLGLVISIFSFVTFMIGITFVIDPNQEFSKQKPTAILNLMSGFGIILTFIMLVLLSVYILILIPNGFSNILESGNTAVTFISINIILFVSMYLAALRLEGNTISQGLKTNLLVTFFVLIVEGIVINSVALYAVGRRVSEYGYTSGRLLALTIILLIFVLLFLKVYSFYKLAINKNLEKHIHVSKWINVIFLIVVLVTCFSTTTFINFETISMRSQFNRFKDSTDLSESLDREYFEKNPELSIKFLAGKYEDSSTQMKVDILFFLRNIKYRYSFRDDNEKIMSLVDKELSKIDREEDNPQLLKLIDYIEDYNSEFVSSSEFSTVESDTCNIVRSLFEDESNKDIEKFCYLYRHRYY